jgi:hypothetical protein
LFAQVYKKISRYTFYVHYYSVHVLYFAIECSSSSNIPTNYVPYIRVSTIATLHTYCHKSIHLIYTHDSLTSIIWTLSFASVCQVTLLMNHKIYWITTEHNRLLCRVSSILIADELIVFFIVELNRNCGFSKLIYLIWLHLYVYQKGSYWFIKIISVVVNV